MSAPARFNANPAAFDAHALLRERRSIRRYRAEQPRPDVLERIFVSVAQSPSAHNRQPWRYYVIEDAEKKIQLANVMGARLAADRRRDGDRNADVEGDVRRSYERITGAPVVILVALTLTEMDVYPDQARNQAEYLMAVQSTAMATQNLLLAAHAEGLGACWMCAPLFCADQVRAALNLPQTWDLQGLITLGYPANSGTLKPRKAMGEFVINARAATSVE